jgi:hypothetical protein
MKGIGDEEGVLYRRGRGFQRENNQSPVWQQRGLGMRAAISWGFGLFRGIRLHRRQGRFFKGEMFSALGSQEIIV